MTYSYFLCIIIRYILRKINHYIQFGIILEKKKKNKIFINLRASMPFNLRTTPPVLQSPSISSHNAVNLLVLSSLCCCLRPLQIRPSISPCRLVHAVSNPVLPYTWSVPLQIRQSNSACPTVHTSSAHPTARTALRLQLLSVSDIYSIFRFIFHISHKP